MDSVPNLEANNAGRRRFRPGLWPTVGMVAVVALTVSLGAWQQRRAAYKDGLAAQFALATRGAVLVLPGAIVPGPDLRYRPVRAAGEFVAGAQMLLDNRVHAGWVGYHVLTPLRLAGSETAVLVNRGWVPLGVDRSMPPTPPVPAGSLVVLGRVALPAEGSAGQGRPEGRLWQRPDIDAMAHASGLQLLPLLIEQTVALAPGDEPVRDWPPPDFGSARHLGYMVQWYSLAALAIVLWVALNWRRREAGDGSR